MSESSGLGEFRDALDRMIESTEYYAKLFEVEHSPTCWKLHTACALKRVRDLLDGEDEESE